MDNMIVEQMIDELKEAELLLKAVSHEDGGLYTATKYRVDALKVKLFDAMGGIEILQKITQLEAERYSLLSDLKKFGKCEACKHTRKSGEPVPERCWSGEDDCFEWRGIVQKG